MPTREHDDDGSFSTKATPGDVQRVVHEHVHETGEPVVTVSDVVAGLEGHGVSVVRETARSRLRELTESGELRRKEVGARAVVWYLAEDSEDPDGDGDGE